MGIISTDKFCCVGVLMTSNLQDELKSHLATLKYANSHTSLGWSEGILTAYWASLAGNWKNDSHGDPEFKGVDGSAWIALSTDPSISSITYQQDIWHNLKTRIKRKIDDKNRNNSISDTSIDQILEGKRFVYKFFEVQIK